MGFNIQMQKQGRWFLEYFFQTFKWSNLKFLWTAVHFYNFLKAVGKIGMWFIYLTPIWNLGDNFSFSMWGFIFYSLIKGQQRGKISVTGLMNYLLLKITMYNFTYDTGSSHGIESKSLQQRQGNLICLGTNWEEIHI